MYMRSHPHNITNSEEMLTGCHKTEKHNFWPDVIDDGRIELLHRPSSTEEGIVRNHC